jgi:hypothetical protein
MIIVIFINGLYVYLVVSGQYSFYFLLAIAVLLSLFKIAWNFILVRGSHFMETISDTTCLFNNLLAPLLAEMFVSSDCFLYIVTSSPPLLFSYNVYLCQLESGIQVCSLQILSAQGYGTNVDVTIKPPFHYSYQCSFSLISSYAYVFIVRYIISGLLEAVVQIILIRYSVVETLNLLPNIWQTIIYLQSNMEQIDQSKDRLQRWIHHVKSGRFRRRLVVYFTTDLSMLICFGALFPPLAIIIALSLLKDVASIRLALGRYCDIMDCMQEGSLRELMMDAKESMDEEALQAGTRIWNGVWYGVMMGTWIWGFVLFDTMASTEGVWKGFGLMIGMIICPYIWAYASKVFINTNGKEAFLKFSANKRSRSNADLEIIETNNPIAGRIEMTTKSVIR